MVETAEEIRFLRAVAHMQDIFKIHDFLAQAAKAAAADLALCALRGFTFNFAFIDLGHDAVDDESQVDGFKKSCGHMHAVIGVGLVGVFFRDEVKGCRAVGRAVDNAAAHGVFLGIYNGGHGCKMADKPPALP